MSTYAENHTELLGMIARDAKWAAKWAAKPEHEAVRLLDGIRQLSSAYIPDDAKIQLLVNFHAMTQAFMDHYRLWGKEAP